MARLDCDLYAAENTETEKNDPRLSFCIRPFYFASRAATAFFACGLLCSDVMVSRQPFDPIRVQYSRIESFIHAKL